MKLKILTSLFSISFALSCWSGNSKSKAELKKAIKDSTEIVTILRTFVKSGRPIRMMGTKSHQSAQQFIIDFIKKADTQHETQLTLQKFDPDIDEAIRLNEQDFKTKIASQFAENSSEYKSFRTKVTRLNNSLKSFKNIPGLNILWEKKGTDSSKPSLLVIAHYDSLLIDPNSLSIIRGKNAPGADYNGSGVAIALKLIEVANSLELKNGLKVALLDYQGVGFLGSYHLAKNIDKATILGVINLEMLGNDSKIFDKNKKSGNMKAYGRKKSIPGSSMDKKLFNLVKKGSKINSRVRFTLELNGFDQSDHFRFWDQGIPAVTFSQNWQDDFNSKRYQTSNDIVESINPITYRNLTEYLLGGILSHSLGR